MDKNHRIKDNPGSSVPTNLSEERGAVGGQQFCQDIKPNLASLSISSPTVGAIGACFQRPTYQDLSSVDSSSGRPAYSGIPLLRTHLHQVQQPSVMSQVKSDRLQRVKSPAALPRQVELPKTQVERQRELQLMTREYIERKSPSCSSSSSSSVTSNSPSPPNASPSAGKKTPSPPMSVASPLAGQQQQNVDIKKICAICEDKASGKHYGVYSCEGCKGFFKRTVRKQLEYKKCRDEAGCPVDKFLRNRCQHCRYEKCISMGMRREAVQKERKRPKSEEETVEDSSSSQNHMNLEKLKDAMQRTFPKVSKYRNFEMALRSNAHRFIQLAADKAMFQVVAFAKLVPHFTSLPLEDRVWLCRGAWNELYISAVAYRSIEAYDQDCFYLASGVATYRSSFVKGEKVEMYDLVRTTLVKKMKDMKIDEIEIACLRAAMICEPNTHGVKSKAEVKVLREKVLEALEVHCMTQYPEEIERFSIFVSELLPACRHIALKTSPKNDRWWLLIGNAPHDLNLQKLLRMP